ncbi:Aldo/keto reductase [Auriculariales sp. MPI-PUGE-AT-0066]|nr:Aldo/keto reductase [Auriculariales sp. MPI-PUGE-AT-0066]
MADKSMAPLGSSQPTFIVPTDIPDNDDDKPVEGPRPASLGPLEIPAVVFGAAALSGSYNDEAHLRSATPLRTVRLALRYGITAFDTSAYYGPSEIILGSLLQDDRIRNEFPRSSYKIVTKCGRYGEADFDYTPATIRASIERSLKRLGTTYLDVVLLHDVEFVAEQIVPAGEAARNHLGALSDSGASDWGLAPGGGATSHGPGDEKVVEAIRELYKLQAEGLTRAVGISGYPLPTLLRLARLISARLKPIDAVLSYSNYDLSNSTFAAFVPQFKAAGVAQISTASPFSMGLLTPRPPEWHPAPPELKAVARDASALVEQRGFVGGLPAVALGFALRRDATTTQQQQLQDVPLVVGLSNLHEVNEIVKAWRRITAGGVESEESRVLEEEVRELFVRSRWANWCWPSP